MGFIFMIRRGNNWYSDIVEQCPAQPSLLAFQHHTRLALDNPDPYNKVSVTGRPILPSPNEALTPRFQTIRSHRTKKAHNPHVARNTHRAGPFLSAARVNSLLPPAISSLVASDSRTRSLTIEDCVSRFAANVVWSSEISIIDRSAVLSRR